VTVTETEFDCGALCHGTNQLSDNSVLCVAKYHSYTRALIFLSSLGL